MLNLQRVFLTLISAALFIAAIILMIQNMATYVTVVAGTITLAEVSLGGALALVSLLMGLAIILKMWESLIVVRSQQNRVSRDLERKEVSREEAQEKVKVLETKVATLERALSEALKHGQSPS